MICGSSESTQILHRLASFSQDLHGILPDNDPQKITDFVFDLTAGTVLLSGYEFLLIMQTQMIVSVCADIDYIFELTRQSRSLPCAHHIRVFGPHTKGDGPGWNRTPG